MHYDFCTLFDRNYLFRGLALHESLERHVHDFTLYILCMDDTVHHVLQRMQLAQVELIALADFEDDELLRAKATRSHVEYCWTCTPSLPLYLLDRVPGITTATYLDADLYFFADPAPVFTEMESSSVGVVGHRYSHDLEYLAEDYGIYNVEFMVFRNDERARDCLVWWRERCNEWCYGRVEDGKYGDQKYLDVWPERFEGVVVLETEGAGLAPWNLRRYNVTRTHGRIGVNGQPLIFFHYHSFTIGSDGRNYRPCLWVYGAEGREYRFLFRPYWAAVKRAMRRTRLVAPGYAYGFSSERIPSPARRFAGRVRRRVGRLVRSSEAG